MPYECAETIPNNFSKVVVLTLLENLTKKVSRLTWP